MRTRVQGVKRYFTSVWSLYVLVTGAFVVGLFTVDDPTPDWVVAAIMVMWGLVAGLIGFIHSITTSVARERDVSDEARESAPLCRDDYCADATCPNRHE